MACRLRVGSLRKASPVDKTLTVIWKVFQIVLWLAAAAYAVVGVVAITGMLGSAREADSLRYAYMVFGLMFLIVGAVSAFVTFLANKSRAWLIVAPLILCAGLPLALVAAFWIDMEKGDVHRRQIDEEIRSGRYDFGDQPALLAVAQAISANDQDAIRVAAKAVPDLQAPGRDGTTLLCWAVRETWQRPQLVESVKTLLSLGADPNFTNGHRDSFAMGNAVHGSARLLQSMLDAGGDPNARHEFGWPIILMTWYLGYYPNDQRARLDLLLDRGADINSTMPESESESAGYTLLLYRTKMGLDDRLAYADALTLLERGADPNRAAADGMTFAKMLVEHRRHFTARKGAPPEFETLWAWAQTHGLLRQPE
jgi:Ankyrin repeat